MISREISSYPASSSPHLKGEVVLGFHGNVCGKNTPRTPRPKSVSAPLYHRATCGACSRLAQINLSEELKKKEKVVFFFFGGGWAAGHFALEPAKDLNVPVTALQIQNHSNIPKEKQFHNNSTISWQTGASVRFKCVREKTEQAPPYLARRLSLTMLPCK